MSRFALIVSAGLLVLLPLAASAQFKQGDWTLQLGGTGSNSSDFNGATFSVDAQLGYFITKELQLSLRQSIGYSDLVGSGSAWQGSTRVAGDYHFDLGRWQPYIGAHVGYVYGEGIADSFEAGPETGIKFFVNETTFINVSLEYQWFLDQGGRSDSFDDGRFVYGVNIGFRF